MNHVLIIAAGGAIGASLRHLVGQFALRTLGMGFPWGTLTVNLAGSFAMGVFIEWLARRAGGIPPELRLFVATGMLGGFTTFSAFSLDFANLWERGEANLAIGYMGASVFGAIAALFAGLWLVRLIL